MSTLTETLRSNLSNPVTSPDFDLYTALNNVLSGVGLSAADSGGKITFYGKDPIVPSCLRFASIAAIALAAKAVAAAIFALFWFLVALPKLNGNRNISIPKYRHYSLSQICA
jgi:hypothetical protein